jgi:hypothetical protein
MIVVITRIVFVLFCNIEDSLERKYSRLIKKQRTLIAIFFPRRFFLQTCVSSSNDRRLVQVGITASPATFFIPFQVIAYQVTDGRGRIIIYGIDIFRYKPV